MNGNRLIALLKIQSVRKGKIDECWTTRGKSYGNRPNYQAEENSWRFSERLREKQVSIPEENHRSASNDRPVVERRNVRQDCEWWEGHSADSTLVLSSNRCILKDWNAFHWNDASRRRQCYHKLASEFELPVMIYSRGLSPTETTRKTCSKWLFVLIAKFTNPVQLMKTPHLIFPCVVTTLVTRSYWPARCFSVRISFAEQSSIIFTPFLIANLAKVRANGTGSTIKSFCTQRPP